MHKKYIMEISSTRRRYNNTKDSFLKEIASALMHGLDDVTDPHIPMDEATNPFENYEPTHVTITIEVD